MGGRHGAGVAGECAAEGGAAAVAVAACVARALVEVAFARLVGQGLVIRGRLVGSGIGIR